ncbi:MAG: hypothetical protein WBV59_11895 [Anaerolineae bacterium]
MTDIMFVDLVRRMRGAQIEYFRVRTTASLIDAKRLEKQVDTALINAGMEGKNGNGFFDGVDADFGDAAVGSGATGVRREPMKTMSPCGG